MNVISPKNLSDLKPMKLNTDLSLSQAMHEKDDISWNHEKGDDESLSQDAKFIQH